MLIFFKNSRPSKKFSENYFEYLSCHLAIQIKHSHFLSLSLLVTHFLSLLLSSPLPSLFGYFFSFSSISIKIAV